MAGTVASFVELQLHFLQLWYRSCSQHELLATTILGSTILYFAILAWYNGTPHDPDQIRKPLVYPTSVPFIGHLLSMAWDTPGFIASITTRCHDIPTQIRLIFTDMYIISGPASISTVWKDPDLHNRSYKSLSIINMFKMPADTLAFWMYDDSGHNAQPRSSSHVPPHLRVDHMTHSSVTRFLAGPGLQPFARRFTTNLLTRLSATSTPEITPEEWTTRADLFAFFQTHLFPAALEALCGTKLLALNPTFVEDFWAFSAVLPTLAKGYPRWLSPTPYRLRDRYFAAVERWHGALWAHWDAEPEGSPEGGWSEEYGAEIIKFRHMAWAKMPRMGADGAVTEDLGMIWAANGNSIPAAFWMIAEIIRDPGLLARVREAVDGCRTKDGAEMGAVEFDYEKLCADDLLQSIYAETLRLHVASFIMRGSFREDFEVRGKHIPKDATILLSSYDAQTDPRGWQKYDLDEHPIDEFWAERFLTTSSHSNSKGSGKREFSLKGRSTDWFPYGGGQRMCPGRHFAKQEMITSVAILLTLFDVELAGGTAGKGKMEIPGNDMEGYGFGTFWPKGRTEVRMRRRRV